MNKNGQARVTDADNLARQLEQDPQMLALKQQFKAQLPALISELQQYFAAEQWRSLAYAAHSLKGSAGSMGYPELTELAGRLERAASDPIVQHIQALLEQMRAVLAREAAEVTEKQESP